MESCIKSNPDISGIGVRISIYIQTFLCFFPAFFFTADGVLDAEEERALHGISMQLIFFSIGLLITTAVEQTKNDVGAHHIMLVLNMCWMVNASCLMTCIFPAEDNQDTNARYVTNITFRSTMYLRPRRKGELWGGLLLSLNLIGTSVLGIWVWWQIVVAKNPNIIHSLVGDPGCLGQVQTVFFFAKPFPLNHSDIGIPSLAFHFLMVIPIVNVFICLLACMVFSTFLYIPLRRLQLHLYPLNNDPSTIPLFRFGQCLNKIALPLIVAIHGAVNTERTIKINKDVRETDTQDEGQWTFGQVIALVLAVVPLFQTVNLLSKRTSFGRLSRAKLFERTKMYALRRRLLYPKKWSSLYQNSRRMIERAQKLINNVDSLFSNPHSSDSFQFQGTFPFASEPLVIPPLYSAMHSLVAAGEVLYYTNKLMTNQDRTTGQKQSITNVNPSQDPVRKPPSMRNPSPTSGIPFVTQASSVQRDEGTFDDSSIPEPTVSRTPTVHFTALDLDNGVAVRTRTRSTFSRTPRNSQHFGNESRTSLVEIPQGYHLALEKVYKRIRAGPSSDELWDSPECPNSLWDALENIEHSISSARDSVATARVVHFSDITGTPEKYRLLAELLMQIEFALNAALSAIGHLMVMIPPRSTTSDQIKHGEFGGSAEEVREEVSEEEVKIEVQAEEVSDKATKQEIEDTSVSRGDVVNEVQDEGVGDTAAKQEHDSSAVARG